jgi:hypothetical protein
MSSISPTDNLVGAMLEPFTAALPLEVAQQLATLKAPAHIQTRLNQLAAKANEGELSPEERADYESLVRAGNILNIIKAKAKKSLLRQP